MTGDLPDTLCDHCINQADCDRHHQMCVNFEPRKDKAPDEESEADDQ